MWPMRRINMCNMQPMSMCTGLTYCSEFGHGNNTRLICCLMLNELKITFQKNKNKIVFLWERTGNFIFLYFGGSEGGNWGDFFIFYFFHHVLIALDSSPTQNLVNDIFNLLSPKVFILKNKPQKTSENYSRSPLFVVQLCTYSQLVFGNPTILSTKVWEVIALNFGSAHLKLQAQMSGAKLIQMQFTEYTRTGRKAIDEVGNRVKSRGIAKQLNSPFLCFFFFVFRPI